MSTPSIVPMMTSIDHAHLRRIASAGMRIRRAPPSAQILAIELERARVVDPVRLPSNVISMHSVFDFRDGITEQKRRAMLVYPGEEDAGLGRISALSPLGAALIGSAEGQSHEWRSATGIQRTLHVIQVVHQPERKEMSQGDMMSGDMMPGDMMQGDMTKDAADSARDNSGRVIP